MNTPRLETKISQERKNNAINQKFPNILKSKNREEKAMVDIAPDLCKECGLCVVACPVSVLRISENLNIMGYHPVEYIGKGCTGCGICFYVCPEPGTFCIHKISRER